MSKPFNSSRYARQIPIIGTKGQQILEKSKVLIVGAGGLGNPLSLYLSQSGVGNLTLIDNDIIQESNLHRQVLFPEYKIGCKKTTVLKDEILLRNSNIKIDDINVSLEAPNASELISNHDVVVDCSDNFETSYLLNNSCRQMNIPLVTASILQDEAFLTTINYDSGPCLECIFPEKPPLELSPNCSLSGILGVDVGIIGLLQTKEVINVLLRKPELHEKIMNVNLDNFRFIIRKIKKRKSCCINYCFMTSESSPKHLNLTYNEIINKIRDISGVQLIDIRTPEEHSENSIGGLNIPLKELSNRISNLDKNMTTIVYCGAGNRSQEAADFLAKNGFNNVINLRGGIDTINY